MPGNISAASPSTVLPHSLSTAFSQTRERPCFLNEYPSGETQRETLVNSSRRSWSISKRLNATQAAALRDFYLARKGGYEPFYFYDWSEGTTLFNYDESGASTVGRYTVRFEGPLSLSVGVGRTDMSLQLVEVA